MYTLFLKNIIERIFLSHQHYLLYNRKNLKNYGEKAVENKEEIFISRRDKKNLVLLSVDKYNKIIKKIEKYEYWKKIDDGIKELNAGIGVHHLIEVDDEDKKR
ncbi:type II toxin-antitoxin system Phd/YefM family antitoxin [Fusobacterium animalis]|uniref:type II toxin-antitoxin system Phd/YefM family antitoxin n=1 Tax=Fusobacterium animalis TaxID=76859 RepID=UPI003F697329